MPKPDRLQEVVDSLKIPEAHTLEDCCKAVVAWVGSLDPAWGSRMEILRTERSFSDKDIVGSLMAYPLDHSMHMEISTHPTLAAAGVGNIKTKFNCLMCGAEATRKYAGQPALCSNRCANGYYARQKMIQEDAARHPATQIPDGIDPTQPHERLE